MSFKTGGQRPKGAGRAKGTPNQNTTDLKRMILTALTNAGGVAYLTRTAKKDPKAFLTLVAKVLPSQIQAELTHSGVPTVEIRDYTGHQWTSTITSGDPLQVPEKVDEKSH